MNDKTVRITVGDAYSTITYAPQKAWPIIRKACRARPEGYIFMPKYKDGVWDGYVNLIKGMVNMPTGLLSVVNTELMLEGMKCDYTYKSKWVGSAIITPNILDGATLRDYQLGAAKRLYSVGRGIAKMATNAGKTLVFAAIIRAMGNANAIVTVQTLDLLYQTAKKLEGYLGRKVGLIGDAHMDDCDILVCTVQTLSSLYRRLKSRKFTQLFKDNSILIIDEAHHTSAPLTFDVLMKIPGWHRYGFSGTPVMRGDLADMKLIACTGPIEVDVSNSDLIEAGWSATPIVFTHYVDEPDIYNDKHWMAAYANGIVFNKCRNELIADIALKEAENGYSSLIIVTRRIHGAKLLQLVKDRDSNMPCMFVHGTSPMEHRFLALRMLGRGRTCIVISTNIFDEGVDVPALDTVILACGGKSHIKLLQRIGRGLRRKAGRNILHVHDFTDDTNKYLIKQSKERRKVYEEEGFEIREIGKAKTDNRSRAASSVRIPLCHTARV